MLGVERVAFLWRARSALRRVLQTLSLGALCLLWVSCSGSSQEEEEALHASTTAATEATAPTPSVAPETHEAEAAHATTQTEPSSEQGQQDLALQTKLSAYNLACLEVFNPSAANSARRYLSWVNRETGPTGHDRPILGIYPIVGNVQACVEAVQRANAAEPSIPEIESAANDFVTALRTLVPRVAAVNTYCERERFLEDGYAQGRRMHRPLVEGFDAYQRASQQLIEVIQDRQDERMRRRLEVMRNDPEQRVDFLLTQVLIQTRPVISVVERIRVDEHFFYVGATLEELDEAVMPLVQGTRALKDYLQTHPEETQGSPGLVPFADAAQAFALEALVLHHIVRDLRPLSEQEARLVNSGLGELVNGSPTRVIGRYHALPLPRPHGR